MTSNTHLSRKTVWSSRTLSVILNFLNFCPKSTSSILLWWTCEFWIKSGSIVLVRLPGISTKKVARSKILFPKKFLCTIYSWKIHRNWKYSWGNDQSESEMSGLLKIVQCRHCSQSILNFQPRCRRNVNQSNSYKQHFHNYNPVSTRQSLRF